MCDPPSLDLLALLDSEVAPGRADFKSIAVCRFRAYPGFSFKESRYCILTLH